MNEAVKWGVLFALEEDVTCYLAFLKKVKPARPCGEDMANLVTACDWLLDNKPPKYVNMGQFRAAVEKLRNEL